MQDWRHYAECATDLLVIADLIGALPIFICLATNHMGCRRPGWRGKAKRVFDSI